MTTRDEIQLMTGAGEELATKGYRYAADRPPSRDAVEAYLRNFADSTIDACRFSFTAGPVSGQHGWYPDGGGVYPFMYLRDFAMMVRGAPWKFEATDIHNALVFFAGQRATDGLFYDGIAKDNATRASSLGRANTSYDGIMEFVDLIYSHFLKTDTTAALDEFKSTVTSGIASIVRHDHLAFLPLASSWPTDAPVAMFGFQDSVHSRGHELMCSVMLYRMYGQLAAMTSNSATAGAYSAEQRAIKAALETYLWAAEAGLFRNADLLNDQHAVAGSAYAVVVGACSPAIAEAIAQTLYDSLPGHVLDLAGKGIFENGQVRHMPDDESWDLNDQLQFGGDARVGFYQNGGHWSTFTGWAARALSTVSPAAGWELILAWYEYLRSYPAGQPVEWSSWTEGSPYRGQVGAQRYGASSALSLQYFDGAFTR